MKKKSRDSICDKMLGEVRKIKKKIRCLTRTGPHNWKWALEQMKEGKTVRRETYSDGCAVELHHFNLLSSSICKVFYREDGFSKICLAPLSVSDYEATDWEIYEE